MAHPFARGFNRRSLTLPAGAVVFAQRFARARNFNKVLLFLPDSLIYVFDKIAVHFGETLLRVTASILVDNKISPAGV